MTSEPEAQILESFARLCASARGGDDADGFSESLWSAVDALGLLGLLTDYDDELEHPQRVAQGIAVLAGYHCLPVPLVEHMLARAMLRRAGLDAPPGRLALGGTGRVVATERNGTATLAGTVAVPWARHADHAVLATAASTGPRIALVPLSGERVERIEGTNVAGEPRDRLRLSDAPCLALADLPGCGDVIALERARYRAALMLGAAESALDLTVAYVGDRAQFGKPLGKFQAVQQSLAVFAGEVTSGLSACSLAFARKEPDWRAVAVAKMRADAAASIGCNAAHQAHGAIGVTAEYPLHRRTRRLWAWRGEDGSGATWARRLGAAVIAAGPDALWPTLTDLRTQTDDSRRQHA